MPTAEVRFYAELGDLLPPGRRGRAFAYAFHGTPSVKDAIEALGVPHTEVELVLLDGVAVDLGARLHDRARLAIYPVFESFDVRGLTRVRPEPLRDLRFVADVHLGRLARLLRLAGLDVRWSASATDEELAHASHEGRVLLTRDRGLLKRGAVTRGALVRATAAEAQLAEVIARFDLAAGLRPFTRCALCNAPLEPAPAPEVEARVPARVRERHASFLRCPGCARLYWAGTHHARMRALLDRAVCLARPPRSLEAATGEPG